MKVCIIAVKKLTHLKALQTVVEYKAYVECRRDGMCFDNVFGILEIIYIPNWAQSVDLFVDVLSCMCFVCWLGACFVCWLGACF